MSLSGHRGRTWLGAVVLAAAIGGGAGCKREVAATAKPAPPPVPVTTAAAEARDVPLEIRTFGLTEAHASVSLRSQISGRLVKVHFREGQDVKEGDLLFSVDPRPAEAALKQAEAVLARDRAQHADAQRESDRQKDLLDKGLAAQAEADRARTAAEALAAAVRADEAAIEGARIQLDYCSIRAPFAGRTGELLVDEGNLVRANEEVLATLHQYRPAEVAFTVPQPESGRVLASVGGPPLRVRVTIPGEADRPETGELFFVDNAVDTDTGALRCKGRLSNEAGRLWPGLYVRVALELGVEKGAIVVPAQAVQAGQKGAHVYVVKDDRTVDLRPVTLRREHEGSAVLGGEVKAGEVVVTDGQFRLSPGARVDVRPGAQPAAAAAGSASGT